MSASSSVSPLLDACAALHGRDLLSIRQLTRESLCGLLALAADVRREPARYRHALAGKTVATIFDQPSLRTHVSFHVAARQLGADVVDVHPREAGLQGRESIDDVARTLDEMVDGVVIRTFAHDIVERLACAASIPVINGLTHVSHPCQALADYLTMLDVKGRAAGLRLAFVGDGNNVANSLIPPGEPLTVATERAHVAQTADALAQIIADGWKVVITHGNGPQVGAALRRSECGADDAYPLTLDVCVASTQAEIGLLLQQALCEALVARWIRRPIATVLTQVVVSATDPAFAHPSKPVGRFYSASEADIRRQAGWTVIEEAPHGYRRYVPSPEPLEIVEEQAIGALLEAGIVVIALGGGGVPVVRRGRHLEGVEAVIDKDLASALLAIHLDVDVFVLSTDVDRIYTDFGQPDACGLGEVTAEELRDLATQGHFPPGTMGPKVEAALRFLAAGGGEAIVTSPDRIAAVLAGAAQGTRVVGCVEEKSEEMDHGPRSNSHTRRCRSRLPQLQCGLSR
jgi:carbamate kinase